MFGLPHIYIGSQKRALFEGATKSSPSLRLSLSLQKTHSVHFLEAQVGIEPTHRGFADRRVTTSPLRHVSSLAYFIMGLNEKLLF